MELKRVAVLVIFSVLLVGGFMFYLLVYSNGKIQGSVIANANETDSHGCLIHLGFTWNETEKTCVRGWVSVGTTGRYQNSSYVNESSPSQNINWTTNTTITENPNSSNFTKNSTNQNNPNNFTINWSKIFLR